MRTLYFLTRGHFIKNFKIPILLLNITATFSSETMNSLGVSSVLLAAYIFHLAKCSLNELKFKKKNSLLRSVTLKSVKDVISRKLKLLTSPRTYHALAQCFVCIHAVPSCNVL